MKKTLLFATFLSVLSGMAFAEDAQYYERVAVKNEQGETKHYLKKVSTDKFSSEKEKDRYKVGSVSSNSNEFYVSLKGGISNTKLNVLGLDASSDSVTMAAVALGKKVNNFRFEIEGIYRDKQDLLLGIDYDDEYVFSDIRSTGAMLNGYYDMPTGTKFTPFVMLGVGFSKNKIASKVVFEDLYCPGSVCGYERLGWEDGDSIKFAYSIGAGFSYQLTNNLNFDVAYRYVDLGNAVVKYFEEEPGYYQYKKQTYDLKSNEFLMAIRYAF